MKHMLYIDNEKARVKNPLYDTTGAECNASSSEVVVHIWTKESTDTASMKPLATDKSSIRQEML